MEQEKGIVGEMKDKSVRGGECLCLRGQRGDSEPEAMQTLKILVQYEVIVD